MAHSRSIRPVEGHFSAAKVGMLTGDEVGREI